MGAGKVMPAQVIDAAEAEAFTGKVLGDTAGLTTTVLASIGDRFGLFRDLAASGGSTSADVAARTRTNERYVREWLAGMAAAGYLRYDPEDGRYRLPAEHEPTLVDEPGPAFFGGIVDPLGIIRSIRNALLPDGVYACLDINCSHRPEDNVAPVAALLYGFSILYCMTTSLAEGGDGLGTLGLHEHKLRELCEEAGFSSVRKVDMENPINNLNEIRP